jgi:D-alanyl-D-alanine carboxypeptidase (penicillin-binding protein 5/6)
MRPSVLFIGLLVCCAFLHTPERLAAVEFDPGDPPPFKAAVLIEAETGTVLYAYNPHLQRSPASTQKLLLMQVVLDMVHEGKFSMDDKIHTSARASGMGGSQVYLKQGEVFSLQEMMDTIAIASANDACVAVAEHVAGAVEGFVDLMNIQAKKIGLQQTVCVNVHGLDDTPQNNRNLTTAYDMALLGRTLLNHEQVLKWTSQRLKPFRQGEFMLYNTNTLLGKFKGLDGLKTGFTSRAGFNLVATAKRGDMRFISVILGSTSEKARNRSTAHLLSWGFNFFEHTSLAVAGDSTGSVALDWGHAPQVTAQTKDGAVVVMQGDKKNQLVRQVLLPEMLEAPVAAGDSLGLLNISLGDSLLAAIPLVAAADVGRMSWWEAFMRWFD